jgi:hypothetical protein
LNHFILRLNLTDRLKELRIFDVYLQLAGGLLTGKYEYSDKDEKKPYGRFFGAGPSKM